MGEDGGLPVQSALPEMISVTCPADFVNACCGLIVLYRAPVAAQLRAGVTSYSSKLLQLQPQLCRCRACCLAPWGALDLLMYCVVLPCPPPHVARVVVWRCSIFFFWWCMLVCGAAGGLLAVLSTRRGCSGPVHGRSCALFHCNCSSVGAALLIKRLAMA